MKKKFVLIIVSCLALALIATGIILLVIGGGSVIYFENKTAIAGDTVSMSFSIKNNPGIWCGQIILNYDTDVLSYVSYTDGDVFDECEVNVDDGSVVLLVNQSELKDTDTNGIIATVSFKIKSTADKGDYEIAFDSETNFSNANANLIEPELENGTITVK